MLRATFRFYEELNDFLSPLRRKRDFEQDCAPDATVKHVVEALGVPHTEVDLILVNGESVDFSRRLVDGDRVSVYPRFESFDIAGATRLRPHPLRDPRLLADRQLGGAVRWLRLLGFDTLYPEEASTGELVRLARAEGRILLTRSRALLMRRDVTHGCFVRSKEPRAQAAEVLERLQLRRLARPFTRCIPCNGLVIEVDARAVYAALPDGVRASFSRFRRCPGCGRVYWEGSHWRRLERLARELCGRAD